VLHTVQGVGGREGQSEGGPAAADRYALVDALRGVSILLVILLHVQIRIPFQKTELFQAAPAALWLFLFRNGNEGVRMFFVISGFLITSTSLRRWGSLPAIDARRFYRLRFARIAPMLGALLVVASLLHVLGVQDYVIGASRVSYARVLLSALTFHVNWLEASRNFYLPASWDVLWSLSVEETFYLLFPLVCWVYRSTLAGHALLLGLFVAGAWVRCTLVEQPMWQSKGYLSCVDAIALGCLTAIVTHGKVVRRSVVTALAVGGGVLAVAVLAFAKTPPFLALTERRLHMTLLSLAMAGLLVAGTRIRLGVVSAALLRPLMSLGRSSYEVYLTHMFVVLFAVRIYNERRIAPDAAYPLLGATLLACWALGALVERWLSAPANRWLRLELPDHLALDVGRADTDMRASGTCPSMVAPEHESAE
jgi:peptidoglycan/LPS O-acetylase OafA/YrhL